MSAHERVIGVAAELQLIELKSASRRRPARSRTIRCARRVGRSFDEVPCAIWSPLVGLTSGKRRIRAELRVDGFILAIDLSLEANFHGCADGIKSATGNAATAFDTR